MTRWRPGVWTRVVASLGETAMVWAALAPAGVVLLLLRQLAGVSIPVTTPRSAQVMVFVVGSITHLCLVWRWWPYGVTRPMTWRQYYIVDSNGDVVGRSTMAARELAFVGPVWAIDALGAWFFGSGGFGVLWLVAGGLSIVSGGKPPWDAITRTDAVSGPPAGRPPPLRLRRRK